MKEKISELVSSVLVKVAESFVAGFGLVLGGYSAISILRHIL